MFTSIYKYIYIYISYIIYHILYIIAEAKRKWIPTIKEVVTNRKKRPFKMLPRIQLSSKIAARYHVWPFKTLPHLQLKNQLEKNPVKKKKKKKKKALQLRKPYRFLFIRLLNIFSL